MTDAERAELAREIALAASGADGGHVCACGVPSNSASEVALANGLAHALDLSLPRPDATRAEVERFLQAARRAQFRSVCVQPRWAALAVRMLAGARSRGPPFGIHRFQSHVLHQPPDAFAIDAQFARHPAAAAPTLC